MNYLIAWDCETNKGFTLDVEWFRDQLKARWGSLNLRFNADAFSDICWDIDFPSGTGLAYLQGDDSKSIAYSMTSISEEDFVTFALWVCSLLPPEVDCAIFSEGGDFVVFLRPDMSTQEVLEEIDRQWADGET
ncbi:MAG: hypothetical protein NT023_22540 [Armatimonadetes bacterium]|nr:hypothetical protein [Armatimonadota bacterium]